MERKGAEMKRYKLGNTWGHMEDFELDAEALEKLKEFEAQEKADREADDYLLDIIMKNPN